MSGQNRHRLTMFFAALFSLAVLVACDTSTTTADDANTATGRRNVNDVGSPGDAAISPQRAVVTERLPYAEVDNELVYGHFAFPADMVDPLPALIVIHEWWGLDDGVRAMADRLAAEGFVVLAVDLFEGKSTLIPSGARAQMLKVVENPANATAISARVSSCSE